MKDIKLYPYRVFTILGLTFLTAILVSSFFVLNFERVKIVIALILFSLLPTALINFALKNHFLTLISWVLIIFSSTLLYYSFANQIFYDNDLKLQKYDFVGQVVNNPEFSDKNQKIEVSTKIDQIKTKILVYAPKYPKLNFGDQVQISGPLEIPQNFEDFDYVNYLKPKYIKYLISKPDEVTQTGYSKDLRTRLVGTLYHFSDSMTMSLKRVLSDPEAGLASGLIFGGKQNLPEDFSQNLKLTGLTHIVALSGYNVTIIFEVIAYLLIVQLGRRKSFFISLSLLLVFIVMTGASSSVMRAAIFIVVMNIARLIGRKADRANVLILTALLMVAYNPFMLVYDLSFQLSFFAFIGILYFAPYVDHILFKLAKIKLPLFLRLILVETLSAQLAVLPLLVAVFGYVSIISPVTNILVLWIIPLAMLVSLLTAVFALLLPVIAKLFLVVAWPVLAYIINVVDISAKLPLATLAVSKIYVPAIVIIYVLISIYFNTGERSISREMNFELERGKL